MLVWQIWKRRVGLLFNKSRKQVQVSLNLIYFRHYIQVVRMLMDVDEFAKHEYILKVYTKTI